MPLTVEKIEQGVKKVSKDYPIKKYPFLVLMQMAHVMKTVM